MNPNPEGFIVEDCSLFIISGKPGSLSKGTENLFRLTTSLPKGDWTMTAKLKIDFQTGKELFFLGIYQDKNNYIVGSTWSLATGNWPSILYVSATKRSKGKDKRFQKAPWFIAKAHPSFSEAASLIPQPILIRLRKTGRNYFVSLMLENMDTPKWFDVEKLTLLRAKGNLVFGLLQSSETEGETTVNVDWVKIEVPE